MAIRWAGFAAGTAGVRRQALERDRAGPAAAHPLRAPEGVVAVGLVHLAGEHRLGSAAVQAGRRQVLLPPAMPEPRCQSQLAGGPVSRRRRLQRPSSWPAPPRQCSRPGSGAAPARPPHPPGRPRRLTSVPSRRPRRPPASRLFALARGDRPARGPTARSHPQSRHVGSRRRAGRRERQLRGPARGPSVDCVPRTGASRQWRPGLLQRMPHRAHLALRAPRAARFRAIAPARLDARIADDARRALAMTPTLSGARTGASSSGDRAASAHAAPRLRDGRMGARCAPRGSCLRLYSARGLDGRPAGGSLIWTSGTRC
jgi:hypothetical protein